GRRRAGRSPTSASRPRTSSSWATRTTRSPAPGANAGAPHGATPTRRRAPRSSRRRREALRAAAADTIAVPMSLDEHVDHYALGRFALLALLGEAPVPPPAVLGYLVHGEGRWPACRPTGL